MTKVLILGANGQLARNTARVLLEKTDVALTLYLRRASRLRNPDPCRVKIVDGDVLDGGALRDAMRGQDVVYANLAGDMARQARAIIHAMHADVLDPLVARRMRTAIEGAYPGQYQRRNPRSPSAPFSAALKRRFGAGHDLPPSPANRWLGNRIPHPGLLRGARL